MRVAFVGKGGAGKSTVSTLFFLKLIKDRKVAVFFDADLNIHVPKLLGIDFSEEKDLSRSVNTEKIKEYLIGSSTKIESTDHFYKTTPPSEGVNLFEIQSDNKIIKDFCEPYKQGYVSVVGTYEEEEIGKSCYHTNLSILENILSFSKLQSDQWIVTDMVAGIDAFSNTLHKQYDALFLVIEPTQESIAVYEQYIKLADHAGIRKQLFVIGNKIEDEEDEEFIVRNIDKESYIGSLKKSGAMKKLRQNNEPFDSKIFSMVDEKIFAVIVEKVRLSQKGVSTRLNELHGLHLKYIDQDYVRNAVGDLSGQIDKTFTF